MPTTRVERVHCFALESVTPGALRFESVADHAELLSTINNTMLNKGYCGFGDLVITDLPHAADTLVITDGVNTDTYEWAGVGANINVAIGSAVATSSTNPRGNSANELTIDGMPSSPADLISFGIKRSAAARLPRS